MKTLSNLINKIINRKREHLTVREAHMKGRSHKHTFIARATHMKAQTH